MLRRDRWRCRYCGRLLIHAEVLQLIAQLAADAFPWVSHHMPMDRTLPAIERLYPAVEHALPLARGWTNTDANLRACCTPCNEWKGNCTLEEAGVALRQPADGWDGLESTLGPLRERRDSCRNG